MGELLETERQVFEEHREEWLEYAVGQFMLIHDTDFIGPYESKIDAQNIGYETFGNVPFLVKRVLATDRSLSFVNGVTLPETDQNSRAS